MVVQTGNKPSGPTARIKRQNPISSTWVSSHQSALAPFDPETAPPTCISSRKHGPEAIQDHVQHYFGCITITERAEYLTASNKVWTYEFTRERERLKKGSINHSEEQIMAAAWERTIKKIENAAVAIDAQYRRTRILREALRKSPDPATTPSSPPATSQNGLEQPVLRGHLVLCVEESGNNWKMSDEYKNGIEIVKKWYLGKNSTTTAQAPASGSSESASGNSATGNHTPPILKVPISPSTQDVTRQDPTPSTQYQDVQLGWRNVIDVVNRARDKKLSLDSEEDYWLEGDVNGYLIQYTRERAIQSGEPSAGSITSLEEQEQEQSASPDPMAPQTPYLVPFEEKLADVRFKGRFPDQRIAMNLLLGIKKESSTQASKFPAQVSESPGQANKSSAQASESPTQASESALFQENILSKSNCESKDPKRIRYFHIPANNMDWVEKAIARYYDELDKNSKDNSDDNVHENNLVSGDEKWVKAFDKYYSNNNKNGQGNKDSKNVKGQQELGGGSYNEFVDRTHTQMLLRPQFWRGQQHGSRSGVIHAIHMRPLCERVSSELNDLEENPKNLVLFMPYLHWDTDRMRNKISKMIDTETERHRMKIGEESLNRKKARRADREHLKRGTQLIEHNHVDSREQAEALLRKGWIVKPLQSVYNLTDILKSSPDCHGQGHTISKHGRLVVRSKLGQYLIDAARLYEGMSTYRDQKMIEEYLYKDPPLHPRRTLDQSYYWTLRTTKARDRDQVVYRGTNTNLEFCHRLELQKVLGKNDVLKWLGTKWQNITRNISGVAHSMRPDADATAATVSTTNKLEDMKWSGHDSKTDERGCDHCRSDIRRISQLVMVDQLWMWILDEKTIITSFPKRYGFNKQDLSGVHRSIRMRLKSARRNQIRSVYDLALIILDECSNTFFDRTKTEDNQPQVMDIFSESIGHVTNQHTISFQHVWHWTQKASAIYRSKSKFASSSELHVPLLDIHPEGKLQREIKDIIDELDIMIHIYKKQKEVMRRFCKHVEHILDPEGVWREGLADRWSSKSAHLAGDSGSQSNSSAHEDQDEEQRRNLDEKQENGISEGSDRKGKGKAKEILGEKQTMLEKQPKPKSAKKEEKEPEESEEERRDKLIWFKIQSQELLEEVDDRLDELKGLKKGAESTATSVNDLLVLKQQQASVVQAWESAKQAEETVRQGRSIMMFTLITIIFLPLSFTSSVFGMNNYQFGSNENRMSLYDQLQWILITSSLVVAVSTVVAFSNLLRAVMWSAYTLFITAVMVYLPLYKTLSIYGVWLEIRDNWCSNGILTWTEAQVQKMKDDVRKFKEKRRKESMQKRGEEEEEKEEGSQNKGNVGINGVQGQQTSRAATPSIAVCTSRTSIAGSRSWTVGRGPSASRSTSHILPMSEPPKRSSGAIKLASLNPQGNKAAKDRGN